MMEFLTYDMMALGTTDFKPSEKKMRPLSEVIHYGQSDKSDFRTAEEIKIRIGSAYPLEDELTMDVRGRDLIGGLPKTITITSIAISKKCSV